MSPRVYVVVLNWNGWEDTLECLECLFRLTYDNFRVVVCDNGSTDSSVQHILSWASGSESAGIKSEGMSSFSRPPVRKPLRVTLLERTDCEGRTFVADAPLTVIQNGANLGFAAGCNVGLRYAIAQNCDYAWLLNNDTVVSPDALSELVDLAEKDRNLGITGSTVWRYYDPDAVQAYGGTRYNKWMARTPRTRTKHMNSQAALDCILGCSMLVQRRFLNEIGLMDEGYFLYFEELDWAARSKGRFRLGYSPTSAVYHKEGSSIGSNEKGSSRSLLSEHYLSRNRIVFTKRFYPALLPIVTFWVVASAVYRLATGDRVRTQTILKAAFEGFRK